MGGFKPLSTYKISLHKSGDTTNACSNVGELYTGTKEHQFKTDTEGRSVLLLHESGLRIRGKDGIMGRSVVITDPQGAEARHCGIVINAYSCHGSPLWHRHQCLELPWLAIVASSSMPRVAMARHCGIVINT